MPLLEAMAFDVPVLARACAAIPETVGDGGLLLPEWAGAELVAEAIARVVEDARLRRDLVVRGAGAGCASSPRSTRASRCSRRSARSCDARPLRRAAVRRADRGRRRAARARLRGAARRARPPGDGAHHLRAVVRRLGERVSAGLVDDQRRFGVPHAGRDGAQPAPLRAVQLADEQRAERAPALDAARLDADAGPVRARARAVDPSARAFLRRRRVHHVPLLVDVGRAARVRGRGAHPAAPDRARRAAAAPVDLRRGVARARRVRVPHARRSRPRPRPVPGRAAR